MITKTGVSNIDPARRDLRDEYITAQALWYALKYIESLPPELQEWSNMQDMRALLLSDYPGFVRTMLKQSERDLQMLSGP